ncbi:Olfactory receptor 14C36 [Sciurus carolinensis]|uniref:Olfactory receptor 14C36 n=1 Tax=Sciurus carolinensis TaxID=30640 RepID=A0AA41SZ30_SCICA|nr:Olfactory receptor 14C36 [Sciurus carolinensis]
MAFDHYVAICQPLQYPIIMNPQFCVCMTLASLLNGLVYAAPTRALSKAFSTCTPHILVVSVFLSSGTGVYLRPSATSDTLQDMLLSACYTMIPPFLNPIIYSLRNNR